MAVDKQVNVMVAPGMIETRTVYGVKKHVPNRYSEAFGDEDQDDDYTGWIHYEGEKVPVSTGYWGGMVMWKLDELNS